MLLAENICLFGLASERVLVHKSYLFGKEVELIAYDAQLSLQGFDDGDVSLGIHLLKFFSCDGGKISHHLLLPLMLKV